MAMDQLSDLIQGLAFLNTFLHFGVLCAVSIHIFPHFFHLFRHILHLLLAERDAPL